tara:strand:+ start:1419 stop:1583 length:165 start_codon:yes stop_codon:yes gene_type:complete
MKKEKGKDIKHPDEIAITEIDKTLELIEEEERSECCGSKIDTDRRLCYDCKDKC